MYLCYMSNSELESLFDKPSPITLRIHAPSDIETLPLWQHHSECREMVIVKFKEVPRGQTIKDPVYQGMEFWIVFSGNQEPIRSFRQYKDTEHDNMWLIRPRAQGPAPPGWQCPYLFSLICLADHLMMQSSAGGPCWVALYSPEAQSLSILRALNLIFRPLLFNGWSMRQYQQQHLGADKKYRVLGPILPYQTEMCTSTRCPGDWTAH